MRVLVVDDEFRLADLIGRGLAAEGFLVELAHNGHVAVAMATEREYDVIVLDLMLPGLSGYRVCEQLRAASVWTPILMLTAKDGEYDQVDAFDLGVDDYLTKPFSFAILTARLRALVRRGAPERPMVLTAGDLSLDPSSRRVERGGHPISLTPREFGLLHYLLRKRGTVASKQDILENVWDMNFDGDANIVDVYIGYLRRKIDHPYGRRSVQTARGVGYVLTTDGG